MIALKHYELVIASFTIIVTISGILLSFIWKSHRARKKDFKEAMNTKADERLFLEKIKVQNLKITLQETRLNGNEEKNNIEFNAHRITSENTNKSSTNQHQPHFLLQ